MLVSGSVLCCVAVGWVTGTHLLGLCRFGDALGQHRPMSHLAERSVEPRRWPFFLTMGISVGIAWHLTAEVPSMANFWRCLWKRYVCVLRQCNSVN